MTSSTSAQLTNLSWQSVRPCWLLRWPNATILLDCAVDMSCLSYFLPFTYVENSRLKKLKDWSEETPFLKRISAEGHAGAEHVFLDGSPEVHPTPLNALQMETVDAIVVSNWMSLVALPFYTEGTGFTGAIYSTDPTVQFGRLVIEELIEYFARCTAEVAPPEWKNLDPKALFSRQIVRSPKEWRPFYSPDVMEESLKKIRVVAFRETVSMLGTVNISAYGSGFAMGSCNWVLTNELEKIAYIASSSCRVSHARPVDWEKLRGADRLIFTSLSKFFEPPEKVVPALCSTITETLSNGGNVLMPIQPTGIVFDFIDLVSSIICERKVPKDTKIYFISPVAKKALAYSNVNAEWLSEAKQNSVYEPREPFQHTRCSQLKVYDSIYGAFSNEFRSPCVCFAGHPSLRIGDAAHLLEMWGADPKNAVVFTDPDFPLGEIYPPFESLKIRRYYYPIDVRIDLQQLNTILPDLKPGLLYIPDAYNQRREGGGNIIQFNPYAAVRYEETVNISGRNRRKRVHVHPDLVKRLEFVGNDLNPDVGYGQLRGYLCAYDNAFELVPSKRVLRPRYVGKLDVEVFKKALEMRSITYTCRQVDGKYMFETERPNSRVTIQDDGVKTNVRADADPDRERMLDIIGSCLTPV